MSSNQRPHISSLTSILRAADAPQAMPSIENHRSGTSEKPVMRSKLRRIRL
jgi:hypothetical protein